MSLTEIGIWRRPLSLSINRRHGGLRLQAWSAPAGGVMGCSPQWRPGRPDDDHLLDCRYQPTVKVFADPHTKSRGITITQVQMGHRIYVFAFHYALQTYNPHGREM